MNMKKLILIVSLNLLIGCNTLKRQYSTSPHDVPNNTLPDDYTITGTTQSDFDLVPIRVVNSSILVKVNRVKAPQAGWYTCDQFETYIVTAGQGGVRLGYLNFTVGGITFPVAPKGTQYEIRSILTSTDHNLY